MFPLLLPFQSNIQLALTFDLGADKIHLITVCWSCSKKSNPVAVTHAASVHLRYLVVTTKPMPNLQHEKQRYVMIHIYLCVLKRQFFNCYHMRVFCISNQLFNVGQYRKEGCFCGPIQVLPDGFSCDWGKTTTHHTHEGRCPGPDSNWKLPEHSLEGYNKGLRNF